MQSELEDALWYQMRVAQVALPERQHRFYPGRRWQVDFAWPGLKVILEVEGGVYSRGRHVRPGGFTRDVEKYNAAGLLGWRVFRVTGEMVKSGEALALVEQILREGDS